METAARLYEDLREAGFEPWMDTEDLLAGERWKERIAAEIEDSDYFVALLSPQAITRRGYVQKELRLALEVLDEFPPDDVFLIPVRLSPCEPQDRRLNELHWIDLFPDYQRGVERLIDALKAEKPRARRRTLDERADIYSEILRLVSKVHQSAVKRSVLARSEVGHLMGAEDLAREMEQDVEALMNLRDRVDLLSDDAVKEATRHVVGFAVVAKMYSVMAGMKDTRDKLEGEYRKYLEAHRPEFLATTREELGIDLGQASSTEES